MSGISSYRRMAIFVSRSTTLSRPTPGTTRSFGSYDKLVDPCSSWTFSELEKPLKPVRVKEEVAAVPDMSVEGLSLDSIKTGPDSTQLS